MVGRRLALRLLVPAAPLAGVAPLLAVDGGRRPVHSRGNAPNRGPLPAHQLNMVSFSLSQVGVALHP